MLIDTYLDQQIEIDKRESQLLYLAFVFLLISAVCLALAHAAHSSEWDSISIRFSHFVILPVWAVGAWLIRRVLQETHPARDPFILPIILCLTGWGLLAIWRLSPAFGARQTAWFLVAIVGMIVILRLPSNLRWLQRYRYLWLAGGLLLSGLTLFLGTNPSGGEPRLWLEFSGFYFQPSEPLRLLLIVFLSAFFAERMTRDWSQDSRFLPAIAPLLVIWGLSIALLLAQRDLGTAMLFLGLLTILLYIASEQWQILPLAASFAVLAALLGFIFFDVVHIRVEAWLDPWADPIAGSYQIVQSIIGIASGGIIGSGPGMGSPGFIPAAHTDFIFPAITEEWGLAGALAMIGLYAILVSRGLKIAASQRDPFVRILAAGLSTAIGLQSILIMGGTIRLLPLTGVTLPFVSYGGSSLFTSFLAIGLLLSISDKKSAPRQFKRPLRIVQMGFAILWCMMGLILAWWSIIQAPTLTARTDNPRRSIASRYSPRGRILDRNGNILAQTIGQEGSYQRDYPCPEASDILGYDTAGLGQAGIERSMDTFLRGDRGYPASTVWWSYLLQGMPPDGLDIRLTLDRNLHSYAHELLEAEKGAIVLLNPQTGEILALASSPTFNATKLKDNWIELINRKDAPLMNRAIQSRYQPGTALGPFLLAWAGETQGMLPDDTVSNFAAPVSIDGIPFVCATPLPQGSIHDWRSALQHGCPSLLANLASELGAEDLRDALAAFDFDQQIDIRLQTAPSVQIDLAPTRNELIRQSIGQASLTISPLQLARALAALAGDGTMPALRLVDAVMLPNGIWHPMSAIGKSTDVLSESFTQDLRRQFKPNNQEITGFQAKALVGQDRKQLSWYLGYQLHPEPRVVIVALEENTPQRAEQIAQQILMNSPVEILP